MDRKRNEQGSMLLTSVLLLIILATVAVAFGFWLAVQSKATFHRRVITREDYYNAGAIQKAVEYIQKHPAAQQQLTDNCSTDVFVMHLRMDDGRPGMNDGTPVQISIWDIP